MKAIWIILIGGVFLMLFLLTKYVSAPGAQKPHALMGQNAPMAGLPPVVFEGSHLGTSEKKIVIFVASWCHHCPQVFDQLKTLGVPIWVVLYHDQKPVSERLQAGAARVFRDETGNFSAHWGLRGVPEFFVLGAKDHVLFHHRGSLDDMGFKRLKEVFSDDDSK